MENGNGKKQEHRLTSLEKDVEYIKERQEEYHGEVMEAFKKLQEKVNDEITTMQLTIKKNRVFLLRLLALTLVLGSFLWIKESRDYLLGLLGFIT